MAWAKLQWPMRRTGKQIAKTEGGMTLMGVSVPWPFDGNLWFLFQI